MFSRDRPERFSATTIALHWILAAAIVFMIVLGLSLDEMTPGPEKSFRVFLHISIGLLVLVVGLGRLLWRAVNRLPPPAGDHPLWQRRLARAVQVALLIAPLYMTVTGIAYAIGKGHPIGLFGLTLVSGSSAPAPALEAVAHDMHALGFLLLILLILLHVAGALKHHFIDRDRTLVRMLAPGSAPKTEKAP